MPLEEGSKVDGWCGRCKLMLRHTIDVITATKITRVHCNTCGARHAHRAQPPRTRLVNGASPMTQERKYAHLLRGRTEANSTPYSISGRFEVGQLISHASFGLGVVTGARDNVKVDILFADGAKVLQQGHLI
jgi:hypothetical protein